MAISQAVHWEIFEQLVEELEKHQDEFAIIAYNAGVSVTTLYNWVNWQVSCPQMRTFIPVAKELGYDVVLRKVKPQLVKHAA